MQKIPRSVERYKQSLREHYVHMSFPPDSCPYIDKVIQQLDCLESDVQVLGDDDPKPIVDAIHKMRDELEIVRGINECLRGIAGKWRAAYRRAVAE